MRLNVPIQLRWSDFDAYGHVNNAEMLRLFEEARIHAFWLTDDQNPSSDPLGGPVTTRVLDGRPGAATLTLIARQEIEYLAPVPYMRQPIDVQLWIGRLGGASLEVCYEVFSPAGTASPVMYARAATTIVLVDAATARPRRINDAERAAWEPYLEAPVEFSQRR
ncbi:acyl-CoA thioesterase [Compostimonas suwonensis]|uniref:Acyl-CoA thioester hydrolase n=1 Tax=Compostimonas suwonensis TaxID=1048394 RepID=A0A2M9BZK1_9MICO|nr:thioesterase family protein [Compostimonas suwonensis]PJJ63509.1 acyl-CoA thioester hydrolase [Compostimonas suwonensis]